MTWVGKEMCREGNSTASIAQCVSFLLRSPLMGRLSWERPRSLLGKLQWVARPHCTLQPFLSGAYKGVEARSSCFSRQMLRSLSTVVVFACLPFVPDPLPPSPQQAPRPGLFF